MTPKISGPEATVSDMKAQFENDHVHAVLIVHSGVLLAVVERSDLDRSTSDEASALGEVCSRIAPGHTAPIHLARRAQHVYTVARRHEAAPTGSTTSAHVIGTLRITKHIAAPRVNEDGGGLPDITRLI
jgi:hypothetical protein